MQEIILHTPEEMFAFWEQLAKKHKVILLRWELWAGKTLFTKGFAKGLGINPDQVQSPTYTYINIYDNKLLHMDLYRLNDLEEMTKKGIFDQMSQFEHICIERPKFEDYLDLDDHISLLIEKIEEGRRVVLE